MHRILTAILLLLIIMIGAASPSEAGSRPHRPCQYEDSINCVWDAKHMGNGEGKSFWVNRKGKVHYISHRTAHRMICKDAPSPRWC